MPRIPPVATAARLAVLDLVRQRPGLSIMGVARALNCSRTTVRYHVRVLLRSGRLKRVATGKISALFVAEAGVGTRPMQALLPWLEVLNHETRVAICTHANDHGIVAFRPFAAATAITRGAFGYHCAALAQAGLLVRAESGWCLALES